MTTIRAGHSSQAFALGDERVPEIESGDFVGRTVPTNGQNPILISDSSASASKRLTAGDRSELLRRIRSRDLAVLLALHQYRYLDRLQIERLMFPDNARGCQYRIKWLRDAGLVHRLTRVYPPGWVHGHSILLLSRRGAHVIGQSPGESPAPYVHRSDDARSHCFHAIHDLESNGFFVDLGVAGASQADEGLYHWVGEQTCRETYRQRRARIAPDGWGRYLIADGEITFFLEWDRATESPKRISQKLIDYVDHFATKFDAHLHNLLFVVPNPRREEVIHRVVARLPRAPKCRIWTSSAELLTQTGVLADVWQDALAPGHRHSLCQLAKRQASSERPAADCICTPRWWERRPAGGEGD